MFAVVAGVTMTRSAEQFWLWLTDLGLPAPWRLDENEYQIIAVNGALECSIEPSEKPHRGYETQTAFAIITAVNTCAGFRAEHS